ncbi:unnamed protein product [Linum tenue]|uniref:Phosphatidylinositol-glycan biosynthesis class F protein n=1 Tax=Linum tenue TaxID=586396 RepID=A0AAV0M3E0_9ROSI|nr:unnamed protein product [Linum tenue]
MVRWRPFLEVGHIQLGLGYAYTKQRIRVRKSVSFAIILLLDGRRPPNFFSEQPSPSSPYLRCVSYLSSSKVRRASVLTISFCGAVGDERLAAAVLDCGLAVNHSYQRHLSSMNDSRSHSKNKETSVAVEASGCKISLLQVFLVHTICGLCLGIGLWIAHRWYSIHLVSHASDTTRLIWIVETPAALLLYSRFRRDPEIDSFLRAVGRGLCALPIGALVHAAVAIVLGAPVGSRYLLKTCNWSLLMSSLTVVPVASVYGSSWRDWQRIFARTEPNDLLEYMLCIPAHGAVIGAWLGAWPMPLDWERPWQEWPICVTYGALIGYVIGMVASFGLACTSTGARRRRRLKGD